MLFLRLWLHLTLGFERARKPYNAAVAATGNLSDTQPFRRIIGLRKRYAILVSGTLEHYASVYALTAEHWQHY